MTRDELLARLRELRQSDDIEAIHSDADTLLVEYINDDEIKAAYDQIGKWYA